MNQNKKDPDVLSSLTPEQYRVTQENGAERPFDNPYWDNDEAGLYVDIVSGEPLFLLQSINLKAAVDGRASRNPSIRKAYPSQSMILMGWCEQKFDRSKLTVILVMCLMTVQLSLAASGIA
jgi:hypothetical protein